MHMSCFCDVCREIKDAASSPVVAEAVAGVVTGAAALTASCGAAPARQWATQAIWGHFTAHR